MRNVPYMLMVAENVCVAHVIMGIFANMVRYLEIVFLRRASVASVISGLSRRPL